MKQREKTRKIAFMALFTAIIIIQNFVPLLGYIPLGPLSLTIIHLTVIVVALVLGPKMGAVIGGIWGTITFIRAFIWPTSPLATIVFINPLVSILPRILVGLVAGYVFIWLGKKWNAQYRAAMVAAILASLTNTLLVLGQIYLFYHGKATELYALDVSALLPYLLGVIATNGVPEAILAGVVAPSVALPLLKGMQR